MLIRYPKGKSSLSLYTPTTLSKTLRRVYSASRSQLSPLSETGVPKLKGVDTDQLPDADLGNFDSPRVGVLLQKTTRSLQLPKLPPIPKPNDSQFKSILLKKLELCKQLCDFENPCNDRQAKDIKKHTLIEINNSFTTLGLNSISDDEIKDTILDVIKINLLRPLNKLDELTLYNPDVGAFKEFDFEHMEYIYRMLNTLYRDMPKYKGFNIDLLVQLLPVLSSKDKRERELIIQFYVTVLTAKPKLFPEIFPKLIRILISDYFDPDPCGIYSALSIIYSCQQSNNNLKDVIKPYYHSHFLPLIRHEHFGVFYFPLLQLLKMFFANNYSNTNEFVRILINIWPISKPAKEEMMLDFLVQSLESARNIDYRLLGRAFKIIGSLCDSPSFKVAEKANKIIISPVLMELISQASTKILPFLLVHIENARNHWSNTVRIAAEDSMTSISRLMGRSASRKKHEDLYNSKEKLKSWASIARAAAVRDRDVYLSEKLGELSKLFTETIQSSAPAPIVKASKYSTF